MKPRMVFALLATLALLAGLLPRTAFAAPTVGADSAGTKTIGYSTYVWGTVTESGAQPVWTEVRLASGWSRSQTGQTTSSGRYTLELTYGFTTPGTYLYRVGSATSSGTVYSSEFTLTRTPWQVGSAGSKPVGQTTYTWGTMPSAANRTVWTQVLLNGSWASSQARTADASGYFAIPLTYGTNTVGRYTYRVAASTARGVVYSQPFTLTRTARVEAYSAGTKEVNQTTYTWGTVHGYGGGQVYTQVLVGGSWATSQVRTSSSTGAFTIPLTYGASTPGTYTFRVAASTPVGTAYSNAFTLTRTAATVGDLVEKWRGQDIEVFPTTRKVVALTFDGGADNSAVSEILSTLRANGVPATFFVTGGFARAYPNDVRAMAAGGHPVGNHSNTHPYFSQITDATIRSELSLADSAISSLTGKSTKPLFRFPYGDRTAYDIQVVNNAGYIPSRWTIDTLGWKGVTEGYTAAVVRQRVLDGLRPGAIVLMHVGAHPHDRSTPDADALQGIINDLRARGYGFATVSDLLRES